MPRLFGSILIPGSEKLKYYIMDCGNSDAIKVMVGKGLNN